MDFDEICTIYALYEAEIIRYTIILHIPGSSPANLPS